MAQNFVISLLNSLLAGKMELERGSLETAGTTMQSYVFLDLQMSANNPPISPQFGRVLLLKDTGEYSPRTAIR
jgi:hypothetical protein